MHERILTSPLFGDRFVRFSAMFSIIYIYNSIYYNNYKPVTKDREMCFLMSIYDFQGVYIAISRKMVPCFISFWFYCSFSLKRGTWQVIWWF